MFAGERLLIKQYYQLSMNQKKGISDRILINKMPFGDRFLVAKYKATKNLSYTLFILNKDQIVQKLILGMA